MQAGHRLEKFVETNGFAQAVIESGLGQTLPLFPTSVCGQKKDLRSCRRMIEFADRAGSVQAIASWHVQIHQDQVILASAAAFDRLGGRARGIDPCKAVLQSMLQELAIDLVIVNHQDAKRFGQRMIGA